MLSYMQGGSVDIWKENIMEDLEKGNWEYEIVGEVLADLKKEFEGGSDKMIKVIELKKVE